MVTKNKRLFELLSQAFMSPDVKNKQELMEMIKANAKQLDASDSDDVYLKVVTNLSNGISQYYLAHHDLPEELMNVYKQIKDDVPEAKLDEEFYRKKAMASGLSSIPFAFH